MKQASATVQIMAGQWKGKKLSVVNEVGLRPTLSRVKETLFNWLMHDIQGADVLDCYTGSGSLTFEAASRYARRVIAIDNNKKAIAMLNSNKKILQAEQIQCVEDNTLHYLKQQATESFDVIFLDPPFHQGLLNPSMALLEKNGYLKAQCCIYMEYEKALQDLQIPESWILYRKKETKTMIYALYKK